MDFSGTMSGMSTAAGPEVLVGTPSDAMASQLSVERLTEDVVCT
jgi:hypothetical protein